MRAVGRSSTGGGKNKCERTKKATSAYLKKARVLEGKVTGLLTGCKPKSVAEAATLEQLAYFHRMLDKHIDLLERRLVRGETIPHEEKVFSVFQPYTELIKKGKLRPNVEIGKKLAI